MKAKRDIIKQLQLTGFLLFLVFALFLILNFVYFSYQEYKFESVQMRTDFVENQKKSIKKLVNRVVKRIEFEKSRVDNVTKEEIKSRVYEAYLITENIYNQNKSNKSKKEIQKLITDALRSIRFNGGNGYFFINDLEGKVFLSPALPQFENKNILNLKDSKGAFVVKEEINILDNKGEGFTVGYWPKPNSKLKKQSFKKISYVKLFRPYNWSIGTGLYFSDVEEKLQNKFLESNDIKFLDEENIFIGQWDGVSLIGENKGKNNLNIEDKNGKKIVQELIKKARTGGGFISYVMPGGGIKSGKSKITYAQGVRGWKWFVGIGFYLDEIEVDILKMQSQLKDRLIKRVLFSLVITIIILSLFLLLINRFKSILKKDFDIFESFFESVINSNKPIDRDQVKSNELDRLAENANKMLEDKIMAENILLSERTKLNEAHKMANLGAFSINVNTGIWESSEILNKIFDIDDNYDKSFNSWLNLIHPEDKKMINDYYSNDILKEHNNFDKEYRIISFKDMTEKVVHERGKLVFDKSGNLIKIIGTIQDITERIQIEAELKKVEKLRSIGTLAGGIAHDFNNILTGVYGNISLAKMVINEDQEGYKYLVESEKSMHRAIRLTKQLLTFAKGGAPVKENINLNLLINEIVKFDLSGSNVKPILDLKEDLWDINVDKGQVSQVFSNLTINANQATPDGGNLYISSENTKIRDDEIIGLKEGNYVKIIMKDEGIGIDEKHLDKIFDPYFTTKQAGNGLGLATSYSIINKHNGQIKAESELGKGTTFTIYLQALLSTSNDNDKKIEEEIRSSEEAGLKIDCLNILIMDDEEMILKLASRMIKETGCSATVSLNGNEAIKLYKKSMEKNETPYDLVILDLTIPGGMGGKETIKQILEINPEAKVIVSSGYSSGEELANYLEYGFKGLLEKPYTIKNLMSIIKKVL